jgi:hypothetical protein
MILLKHQKDEIQDTLAELKSTNPNSFNQKMASLGGNHCGHYS